MHATQARAEAVRRTRPRVVAFTVLAAVVALIAACGTEGDDTAAPPEEPSTPIVVDWVARTAPAGTGEYTVRFCEGDGPFLCLSKDGEVIGAAELGYYDADSSDVVRDALAGGASLTEALRALAADFVATFMVDRSEGCGADYLVSGDEPIPATVGGQPGLRYGWTAHRNGEAVERVVIYGVIADGTLYTLVASGLGDEGCLERMGEFPIDELNALLPTIDRIAAGSKLPAPAAEVDQRVRTARTRRTFTPSASVEFDSSRF